jgi:HAD superfamily hydrolase (TIGR01509 family)
MAERTPLEAVVFDAGGTLLRLDFEWMSDTLAALGHAVPAAALRRGEIEGRRRYDASRAGGPAEAPAYAPLGLHGDIAAYFTGTFDAAGVPHGLWPAMLERLQARHVATGLWIRPIEHARATLDALMGTPLRLACVSNSDGRAEQHLADCGVRAGLEFVVDSARVAVEKPDPRIFRIALERLGVAPERALYVGDLRSVDEAGARAAGMRFVLIDPWMDYGEDGDRIADIAALPAWIAARFDAAAAMRGVRGE